VKHTDDRNYIINSEALSSTSKQQTFSNVPFPTVDVPTQMRGLHEGLSQWHAAGTRSGPPMPVEEVDPNLV
jgi:hypothetical protein